MEVEEDGRSGGVDEEGVESRETEQRGEDGERGREERLVAGVRVATGEQPTEKEEEEKKRKEMEYLPLSQQLLYLPQRHLHHRSHINALKFDKLHGLGNDFLIIDNRSTSTLPLTSDQCAKMCDRNFGVGADGVVFVLKGAAHDCDYEMRIINSDGTEPEMCGNAILCMVKYIRQLESTPKSAYKIWTKAGLIQPSIESNGLVRVDMGVPILSSTKVPTTLPATQEVLGQTTTVAAPLVVDGTEYLVTCVSMGNPHAVVFVDDLDTFPLSQVGPLFECHPVFPKRTNTEFVQVIYRSELKMVVWERGAGPTLACGTGTCALVVAAILTGRVDQDRPCLVHLPGGDLEIFWDPVTNKVFMAGNATYVFSGDYQV